METVTCSNKKSKDRIFCNQTIFTELFKRIKNKINTCNIRNDGKNGNCGNSVCSINNGQKSCDINEFQLNYISSGLYGTTFNTTITINGKNYDIILKIQELTKTSRSELQFIKKMSSIIRLNPHFVKYYNGFTNSNAITLFNKRAPNNMKKIDIYEVLFVEKFKGDVEYLSQSKDIQLLNSIEIQKNLLSQIILSIFSFHNYSDHYHNDTHSGNFLYAINDNVHNDYYEYKFQNKKWYLKKTPLKIAIWDFGYCQPINSTKVHYTDDIKMNVKPSMMFYDYSRILFSIHFLFSKNQNFKVFCEIIQQILNIVQKYDKMLLNNFKEKKIKNTNDVRHFEYLFFNELINKNMLFDDKPMNAKIEDTFWLKLPYEKPLGQNINTKRSFSQELGNYKSKSLNQKFNSI